MIAAILAFSVGFASVLALFALGAVVYRISIGKDEQNDLTMYIGFVTLVAGAGSDVLGNQGRWPSNTVVACWRIGALPANPGHLACDFTPATGTVSITSDNALDTSTVAYIVYQPG